MLPNSAAFTPMGSSVERPEEHKSHMADGRESDEAFQIPLAVTRQGAVEDADHRECRKVGSHVGGALRQHRNRDPHHAVGTHLQEYPGEQHRADSRSCGMRIGQPGV